MSAIARVSTACRRAAMVLWGFASLSAIAHAESSRLLDDFSRASDWRAGASNQVQSSLRSVDGPDGKALCLDYDFNHVSGFASMRRELPLTFPANYEFDFQVRGEGSANSFEFKLIDASGDNVWWVSKPNTVLPKDWQPVRYKARHISPAWGPLKDKTLRQTQFVEFTLSANTGGTGSVCIADLRFRERAPMRPDADWPAPTASFSSGGAVHGDGGDFYIWQSRAKTWQVTLDFGALREFGGIALQWIPGEFADRYTVDLSDDGKHWRRVRDMIDGDGQVDPLMLSESEARYVRFDFQHRTGDRYTLLPPDIQPLSYGASVNDFVRAISRNHEGEYPIGFRGKQSYWTVVGVDGGSDSGLLGEDGTLEVARGGFSIEPMFSFNIGERNAGSTNASVVSTGQRLLDGYLPMPGVCWKAPSGCVLDVETFAAGDRAASRLVAKYTLRNTLDKTSTFELALAIRPFQVNPPQQFLTTPGGFSPIYSLGFDNGLVDVNGKPRVRVLEAPTRFLATRFDRNITMDGMSVSGPAESSAKDSSGLASGALIYRITLPPGGSKTVVLDIPLSGEPASATGDVDEWFTSQRAAIAAAWHEKLDRVGLRVPTAAQPIADTLRTALAHMLIERDGVQLRPGTRSYARSWIRDGAMMGEALLRLGHEDAAKDFLDWFAPFQFADGKVPCCVDSRGSDPVPENDSHGELLFLANEVFRYTHDTPMARRVWPHVASAVGYMDTLAASERTAANAGSERYGMMPPSISHEGYSSKPAYSYWDDFWAYIGYRSAAELATSLGEKKAAAAFGASQKTFLADLLKSIDASTTHHDISYIPGAADLGDFDATSTTIALSPGGLADVLPPPLLGGTFDRYWTEFVARRDGEREWKDYTPYEWRNVAAMIRLGWRDRALEAIEFFMGDRRPAAWNQWAEVVGRDAREVRFIGDMPHGWVASDYIRSALDLFAYERRGDSSLVIGAGVPAEWLDGGGVGIADLRTPFGKLTYTLRREGKRVHWRIEKNDFAIPSGGIVLAWAGRGFPGTTRVQHHWAKWKNRELKLSVLPVDVWTEEDENLRNIVMP